MEIRSRRVWAVLLLGWFQGRLVCPACGLQRQGLSPCLHVWLAVYWRTAAAAHVEDEITAGNEIHSGPGALAIASPVEPLAEELCLPTVLYRVGDVKAVACVQDSQWNQSLPAALQRAEVSSHRR